MVFSCSFYIHVVFDSGFFYMNEGNIVQKKPSQSRLPVVMTQENTGMKMIYENPVPPYPGWERRIYRLPRPVTREDILEFSRDQELWVRETGQGQVYIIHKYGLLELNFLIGKSEVEVWFNSDKKMSSAEYIEALFMTRF